MSLPDCQPPYAYRPDPVALNPVPPERPIPVQSAAPIYEEHRSRLFPNSLTMPAFRSREQGEIENNISLELIVEQSDRDYLYATSGGETIDLIPSSTTDQGTGSIFDPAYALDGSFNPAFEVASGALLEGLIESQTEINYDGIGTNGIFVGGSDYVVGDTITLSDDSVITVDTVSGGVVTQFTITTGSNEPVTQSVPLTQTSTSGIGTGFVLTPELSNVVGLNIGLVAFNFSAGFASGYTTLTFKVKGVPNNILELTFFGGGSDVTVVHDITTSVCSASIGNGWYQMVIPMVEYGGVAVNTGFSFASDTSSPPGSPFTFLLTDISFGISSSPIAIDTYDITLVVRRDGVIMEKHYSTQEVTISPPDSINPCIGGIGSLRTIVNNDSTIIEMRARGKDFFDLLGSDPDDNCLIAFNDTSLTGGSGAPIPTQPLLDSIFTGNQRSMIIISTTEGINPDFDPTVDGFPVLPPDDRHVQQYDGTEFIQYINKTPGACPI
jgi:hypothetical protein